MNVTNDAPRQTMGQKPLASVSQTVPLHLRYWPIAVPKMQGIIPNVATLTIAVLRLDELPILCPFEDQERLASLRSTLGVMSPLERRSRPRSAHAIQGIWP